MLFVILIKFEALYFNFTKRATPSTILQTKQNKEPLPAILQAKQKYQILLAILQTIQKYQLLPYILQTMQNEQPLPDKYYFLPNK